jgi:hypothetical protein
LLWVYVDRPGHHDGNNSRGVILFFWLKKIEVTLDFFTYSPLAFDYAKPDFAYKFFPDWFLKLPKQTGRVDPENTAITTLKSCIAFKRYYTANTLIIPVPYNATIEVGTLEERGYKWRIRDQNEVAYSHDRDQFEGFVTEDYQHIKLLTPWKFKSNRYVEFLWSDPIWNRQNFLDYAVLPGVVDYKYQFDTPVNLMFRYRETPHVLQFNLGDPFVMLAPLSDCTIKIKHHLVDKDALLLRSLPNRLFSGPADSKYKRNKKLIDAAEKRDAMKKCPFHLR